MFHGDENVASNPSTKVKKQKQKLMSYKRPSQKSSGNEEESFEDLGQDLHVDLKGSNMDKI